MAITLNPQPAQAVARASKAKRAPRSAGGRGVSFRFGKSVSSKEILFFSSQISLMLEIGTPVNQALKAIARQTDNPVFKKVIQDMLQEVEDGRQLSDAMRRHPRVFDDVFSSMVKAGETVGLLKETLDRLVEIEEKRQALKTQIKSALTYPVVLCILAVLVVIFVIVAVLPKFTVFFAGKENVLPATTRFLIMLSKSLKGYWWVHGASLVGLVLGMYSFVKSKAGGVLIDKILVAGPVIGKLSNKIYNSQLLRTLGSLLQSHVPLLDALEVTRGTIGNRYFKDFIDDIINHVRDGGRFSTPFADYPYALESVKQMVATGEEAGNLPKAMLRLAEFYDGEVNRELKGLAALIEPVALIILGAAVGITVSSVVLPLFKLAHMMG